jgi:hypothetical protein
LVGSSTRKPSRSSRTRRSCFAVVTKEHLWRECTSNGLTFQGAITENLASDDNNPDLVDEMDSQPRHSPITHLSRPLLTRHRGRGRRLRHPHLSIKSRRHHVPCGQTTADTRSRPSLLAQPSSSAAGFVRRRAGP